MRLSVERNQHPTHRYRRPRATEDVRDGLEASETPILPMKSGKPPQATLWRKGESGTLEPLEGKMAGTSSPTTVSTKLQRIATLAREAPELAFTTLAHHIDLAFLKEAYRRTRKDRAVSVDGQTAQAYAEDLESHLDSLLYRFKSGTYQAPPVRRVYIPKDDSRSTRPLGILGFEDKVLQRAVVMVLEAIYMNRTSWTVPMGFAPNAHSTRLLLLFGIRRCRWAADG